MEKEIYSWSGRAQPAPIDNPPRWVIDWFKLGCPDQFRSGLDRIRVVRFNTGRSAGIFWGEVEAEIRPTYE